MDSEAILCIKNIPSLFCVKLITGGRACRVDLWKDRETWGNMELVRYRKIPQCGNICGENQAFPPGSLIEAGIRRRDQGTTALTQQKSFTFWRGRMSTIQ